MKLKIAIGLAVVLLVLAVPGYRLARNALLDMRADPAGQPVVVEVPKGEGLGAIAARLQKAGVVRKPQLFVLAARLTGRAAKLQAGEYRLSPAMTQAELLDRLEHGRVVERKVVLPEGVTLADIARALDQAGVAPQAETLALMRDRAFLDSLGVPGDSLEGYLFPDTYLFPKQVGAKKALQRLYRHFQRAWEPLASVAKAQGLTRHQAVTLASIIEAEALLDQERPLISAVYHNRLKKGMPLQADPTVIYGMKDFDGNLRRADLEADTPYNTYTRAGLPPGPICSPGAASLAAAAQPAPVKYLYFVAKGDGSHHFSANYRGHVNAVNRFQKRRRN